MSLSEDYQIRMVFLKFLLQMFCICITINFVSSGRCSVNTWKWKTISMNGAGTKSLYINAKDISIKSPFSYHFQKSKNISDNFSCAIYADPKCGTDLLFKHNRYPQTLHFHSEGIKAESCKKSNFTAKVHSKDESENFTINLTKKNRRVFKGFKAMFLTVGACTDIKYFSLYLRPTAPLCFHCGKDLDIFNKTVKHCSHKQKDHKRKDHTKNVPLSIWIITVTVTTLIIASGWLLLMSMLLYCYLGHTCKQTLKKEIFARSFLLWIVKRWNLNTFAILWLVFYATAAVAFIGYDSHLYWPTFVVIAIANTWPVQWIIQWKRAIMNDRTIMMNKQRQRSAIMSTSSSEYAQNEAHESNWVLEPLQFLILHGAAPFLLKGKLRSKGADSNFNVTDLCLTVRNNDVTTATILLEHAKQMQGLEKDYRICFMVLFQNDNYRMIKVIIEALKKGLFRCNIPIKELLYMAIRYECMPKALDIIDDLWYLEDNKNSIYEFYSEYFQEDLVYKASGQICFILKVGITRHVREIASDVDIPSYLHTNALPIHQWMYLLSKNILSLEAISEIQRYIEENNLDQEYEKSTLFSTTLSPESNICAMHGQSDEKMQIMFREIMSCVNTEHPESTTIKKNIESLMGIFVHVLQQYSPLLKCKPVLVGSAKEGTRCSPDEFDYLFVFEELAKYFDVSYNKFNYEGKATCKPDIKYNDDIFRFLISCDELDNSSMHRLLYKIFQAVKEEISQSCVKQGLFLSNIGFEIGRSYSYLCVTWNGQILKYMNIKIDVVPVFPFLDSTSIPDHAFLKNRAENKTQYVTLKSEYAKSKLTIAFSSTENLLINALPFNIRKGYKLAKAMRNKHMIAPDASLLVNLGVVHNLEDLISSYMLKNCVMYLTQELYQGTEIENDYIDWAVRIYRKLKSFLTKGKEIPNFLFVQPAHMPFKRTLFRCHRRRFDVTLVCCRKRDAMLVVTNRILQILQNPKFKKLSVPEIVDTSENGLSPVSREVDVEMACTVPNDATSACESEESDDVPLLDHHDLEL